MRTAPAGEVLPEAKALPSRAKRFRLKAGECLQLAKIAQYLETKRIYKNLALSYEQLAEHAESIEEHEAAYRRLRKIS